MLQSRATAAFALAVFLFGGWLPSVLHGPPHEHAASADEATPVAQSTGCACGHHHADDAASEQTPQPAAGDCPVCDLLSVVAAPVAAVALPPLSLPVPPQVLGEPRVARTTPAALPPLRGPPRV